MKYLVRIHKPEIMLVQETKMEETAILQAGKKFWKKGPGIGNNSRGAYGGIATFWDSTLYDLEDEERALHWIFTKLIHKPSGKIISLFNLYVLVLHSEKKDCWSMLESFLNLQNLENIIVAGDLNVTLAANEKKGGTLVRDPSREWVEDIILGWDLIDIKPVKRKFTWTNKRIRPSHVAA